MYVTLANTCLSCDRLVGELFSNTHPNAMNAYNKMHVGYKVKVEWGIGGFKRNW